jgi:hypothetical protein
MNIVAKHHEQKQIEETNKVLLKNRKEVEIMLMVLLAYKIKEGDNKDKVLGHIATKSKEI